jgi:hypothetical protein
MGGFFVPPPDPPKGGEKVWNKNSKAVELWRNILMDMNLNRDIFAVQQITYFIY